MIHELAIACSGAVFFGYITIALFFVRYWQQTRLRLFGCFAAAFFILALERSLMLTVVIEPVHKPLVYCTRLVAFLVIAGAIWDANRRQG